MDTSNEWIAEALDGFRGIRKKKKLMIKEDAMVNTTEDNIEEIKGFIDYLIVRGRQEGTIHRHLYCLKKFIAIFGENKQLKDATKKDIASAVSSITTSNLAAETRRKILITTKLFYKHVQGDDEFYPKTVSWITAPEATQKEIKPGDLLTEEEVKKLINASKHVRDKAIIAVLFDAGVRVGELISMRKCDVNLKGEPGHITVSGKTGLRVIPILMSAPYLSVYLETVKHLKNEDALWVSIGTWLDKSVPINENAVRKLLWEAADEAGITKRVNPHSFRHARASYYGNRLTEPQLRQFFGWSKGSEMTSVYVHLSGRDIDNSVMMANGKKMEEIVAVKTSQVCKRCEYEANSLTNVHCSRCGAWLDEGLMIKEDQKEKMAREVLIKMASNPEYLKKMLKDLKNTP